MKIETELKDKSNEAEKKQILREYRSILRAADVEMSDEDHKLIRKAFDVAREAHDGVRRKSGEPYIFHPIAVAKIVAHEIGMGKTSIVCALLHDVVEDTDLTIEDIRGLFGDTVAKIIDGLTKIEGVFDLSISLQAENFRKIILTLADDVRVILIKLADRLHNMRTLDGMRKDKQLKIASETLYIYAPLAHRLGLYTLKSDLEDLSLKYKAPTVYEEIESKLQKTKAVRTRFVNRFTLPIRKALDEAGLSYSVKARTKSIYSIWSKMRSKNVSFEEVYDVFAIRIVIDSDIEHEKADCWRVYSMITDFYQPNPDRLRDWVSTPKANGYESLHTTVMSPTGKWVEVQIRSKRMDEIAEKGLAAHWKYKEAQKAAESALDDWITRIRELLENPETNAIDFVDDFKLNLFAKEIFVFTPKGDIRSLPHKATALDFAYDIHSDLGKRCIGAKVNQKLVPLSYQLNSGDQVDILTSRAQQPKSEWLDFVVTAKAKGLIKGFLREEKKRIIKKGNLELLAYLEEKGIQPSSKNLHTLCSLFKVNTPQELDYRVGLKTINFEKINQLQVDDKGHFRFNSRRKKEKTQSIEEIVEVARGNKKTSLVIGNTQDLNYILAHCCNPIPGDDVVGFIRHDSTIAIHRVNCVNTEKLLSNYAYRVVRTKWDNQEHLQFLAGLKIDGMDRQGIVNELTKIISNDMTVNIRSISFDSTDGVFDGTIMVYVNDTKHLKDLQDKMKSVNGVLKVLRIE